MAELVQILGIDPWQFGLIVISALLIGFSKTGIGGVVMIAIPILALAFGGKVSTGIILPMLIAGDILAVAYYHRHADWPGIRRLLPWTVLGLLAGILVGNMINDRQFTLLIAATIFANFVNFIRGKGLKKLITESGILEVPFSAKDGKECLHSLAFEQPDVLLLDINLPDYSGIDLCKEIHQRWPKINIIIFHDVLRCFYNFFI